MFENRRIKGRQLSQPFKYLKNRWTRNSMVNHSNCSAQERFYYYSATAAYFIWDDSHTEKFVSPLLKFVIQSIVMPCVRGTRLVFG